MFSPSHPLPSIPFINSGMGYCTKDRHNSPTILYERWALTLDFDLWSDVLVDPCTLNVSKYVKVYPHSKILTPHSTTRCLFCCGSGAHTRVLRNVQTTRFTRSRPPEVSEPSSCTSASTNRLKDNATTSWRWCLHVWRWNTCRTLQCECAIINIIYFKFTLFITVPIKNICKRYF